MEKVSSGDVTQTHAWYFISKDVLFWLIMLISTVIGVISISQIINSLAFSFDTDNLSFVFLPLQIFWILVLIVATTIGWRMAKMSQTLYRFRHATVILTSILISIFGGYLLSLSNAHNMISSSLYRHSAYYQALYVDQLRSNADTSFENIRERERMRTLCLQQGLEEECLPEFLKENSESDINQ